MAYGTDDLSVVFSYVFSEWGFGGEGLGTIWEDAAIGFYVPVGEEVLLHLVTLFVDEDAVWCGTLV